MTRLEKPYELAYLPLIGLLWRPGGPYTILLISISLLSSRLSINPTKPSTLKSANVLFRSHGGDNGKQGFPKGKSLLSRLHPPLLTGNGFNLKELNPVISRF